jgi:hypothetical protein
MSLFKTTASKAVKEIFKKIGLEHERFVKLTLDSVKWQERALARFNQCIPYHKAAVINHFAARFFQVCHEALNRRSVI